MQPPTKTFMKKMKSLTIIAAGGSIMFTAISLYSGDSKFYSNIAMPLLHKIMDPETAHRLAVTTAKYGIVPKSNNNDNKILQTSLWGLQFKNPVGLAAGFDKDCETLPSIFNVGFGFVEIGSITPKPQPGNPKPRVFRLKEDEGIINRFGFNSQGHEIVYTRLKDAKEKYGKIAGPIGVNLGKNKDSNCAVQDYVEGIKRFEDIADYIAINISSPNTPGLRSLQKAKLLEELIDNVLEARAQLPHKFPVVLKISPDMSYSEKEDVAKIIRRKNKEIDGLIVSNTTVTRPDNLIFSGTENGGLSGKPLRDMATDTIKDMFLLTKGQVPIIGVGGVFTGKDAYDKIKAGASLIQLYTALIYKGPPVVKEIKKELKVLLQADGFSNIQEAVGADHKSK